MELLERYLQAVKVFLPSAQRQDIVAELSEDIRSQVEEKEAELGRTLTAAELEAILERWGQPMAVAERYLPQQYLIGPALYPLYLFVLKLIAGVYLVPWVLVWIGFVIFDPAYRDAHLGSRTIDDAWNFGVTALTLFAVATLIFARVERRQLRARADGSWRQRTLLGKSDPNEIPLSTSVADLVANALVGLWWLDLRRIPPLWSHVGEGDGIALAAIWQTLYWPILLQFVANVAVAVVDLIWSSWTRFHSVLKVVNATYCLVLIGLLLSGGPLVEITTTTSSPEEVANFQKWLNLSITITLALIGLWSLGEIVVNARRIVRDQRS